TYIDNYAACQCRRSPTLFYEHSVNVEGLLRRCGVAGLTNPFGNPYQYRPGQGTQTFSPSGGPGTTGAPGAGTSTTWVGASTTTAAPIEGPVATPVETVKPVIEQDNRMSGGAIAGTVLGSLAALALAGLLGWCWRKKRAEHTTLYSNPSTTVIDPNAARAPTRTVVTEKIEPVVVKSVPTTNTHVVAPGATTYSTSSANNYNNTNTGYNSNNTVPVNTYSSASNPTSTTHTTYNTTTTNTNTGYNSQPRTGGVLDSVSNGVHNAANATGHAVGSGVNAVGHGVNSAGNAVGNGVSATGHAVGNGVNAVGNSIHGTSNAAGNTMH
ncbi:hypothetical protein BGZ91_006921, partial [Linnemannia elongata]